MSVLFSYVLSLLRFRGVAGCSGRATNTNHKSWPFCTGKPKWCGRRMSTKGFVYPQQRARSPPIRRASPSTLTFVGHTTLAFLYKIDHFSRLVFVARPLHPAHHRDSRCSIGARSCSPRMATPTAVQFMVLKIDICYRNPLSFVDHTTHIFLSKIATFFD